MTTKIDDEYIVRPATEDDLDAVVALTNAAAIEDIGMAATNREDKLLEWGLPQFYLETDTLLVLAPDRQGGGRQLVGLVELWDSEPHVRYYLWGRVHPDFRGRGIGNYLMAWAETRAGQSLGKAPPEARVSIHTSAAHEVEAAHKLFEQRDYTPTRHFFRMVIEMEPGAPPPPPSWPEGIAVRSFVLGQDDRAVHHTLDQAFKDHWGYVAGERFEEWLHWIEKDEAFDPSVCFLAVIISLNLSGCSQYAEA